MKLSKEETDIFYRLIWSLLYYTNQKYPIIKNLKEPMLKNERPEDIFNLHEKLFTNPELIDSFTAENPNELRWREFVSSSLCSLLFFSYQNAKLERILLRSFALRGDFKSAFICVYLRFQIAKALYFD